MYNKIMTASYILITAVFVLMLSPYALEIVLVRQGYWLLILPLLFLAVFIFEAILYVIFYLLTLKLLGRAYQKFSDHMDITKYLKILDRVNWGTKQLKSWVLMMKINLFSCAGNYKDAVKLLIKIKEQYLYDKDLSKLLRLNFIQEYFIVLVKYKKDAEKAEKALQSFQQSIELCSRANDLSQGQKRYEDLKYYIDLYFYHKLDQIEYNRKMIEQQDNKLGKLAYMSRLIMALEHEKKKNATTAYDTEIKELLQVTVKEGNSEFSFVRNAEKKLLTDQE